MFKSKKRDNVILAIALIVVVVFVCTMVDIYLGIGTLIGGAAVFFGWPVLKELYVPFEGAKEETLSFLDTAVLQENFQIPHNLPIPYAVLDIRGHILMYNEKFAEVFTEIDDAKPIVEKLLKNSGGG